MMVSSVKAVIGSRLRHWGESPRGEGTRETGEEPTGGHGAQRRGNKEPWRWQRAPGSRTVGGLEGIEPWGPHRSPPLAATSRGSPSSLPSATARDHRRKATLTIVACKK